MIIPMPFGASKSQKAFPFLPCYFFLVSKDANIFHLKLNNKPNFFPISTPSKYTPLPQPTYSKQSIVEMKIF
jgi:hypothetical protein